MSDPKITYSDVALESMARQARRSKEEADERLVKAFESALDDLVAGGPGCPKREEPKKAPDPKVI